MNPLFAKMYYVKERDLNSRETYLNQFIEKFALAGSFLNAPSRQSIFPSLIILFR